MAKTVLITGCSSGIGKATAELFAKSKWNVAATSRKPKPQLFAKRSNVKTYQMDVTDTTSIQKCFKAAIHDFGQIDVVVNNAGYGLDGIFEAMENGQILHQFEVNVFGLMHVTREAIRVMRPAGQGKIIQVASMGGRLAFPLYSVYHASKWVVEGFCESLHYELQTFGIKVKIIEPGVIKSEFYGSSRVFAKPHRNLGYDDFVSKAAAKIKKSERRGEEPSLVVRVILKAANDNSNKLRFAVGAPAPALLLARKLLPERFFLWLVRLNYKL